MRIRSSAIVMLALFAAPLTAQIQLYSTLNGAQEVPPAPTTATGVGRATFNANGTVTYLVTTTGLTGPPTVAHIHLGVTGASGAPFVTLTAIPATNNFKGTSAVLTAAQRTALLTDGSYFNVHTGAFGGGEIRGQILGVRRSRFTAMIDGAQETPPSGSAATGTAELWLSEPENVLTYEIDTAGLAAPAVAHLHAGAVGSPGPILVGLNGSSPRFCGVVALTASDVTSLKAGATYLNIHTLAFPGGEIRGQVLAATEEFTAFCTGSQEVPANASVHTACATFVYNPTTMTLQYQINTTLPAITVMHLHTGPIGLSGGVAVGLAGTPPVITGTVAFTSTVHLGNLRRGNLDVNLHTAAFGGGELRGNLRPAGDVYGFGSPDSAGGPPRMGTSGYIGQGAPFEVNVFDAAASQPFILFIGLQSLFWVDGGVPLPFDASVLAPCAFVWTDWSSTVFLTGVTDTEGCGSVAVSLPASPFFDCLVIQFQAFITDPNANPFGFTTSDAVHARVAQVALPY